MRRRRASVLGVGLVGVAALTGCGSAPITATGADGLRGPLTALPSCSPPPAPSGLTAPAGLVLPEGTVVTGVREQGPLTQVTGYVPLTPVEVRLFVEGRQDLTPLRLEDEVFEAELLVSDGTRRTYLKAIALCDRGSSLDAVLAPESAAGGLPVPTGSPAG